MSVVQPDAALAMALNENEVLRERIADMERAFMGSDLVFPVTWCLHATEQRMLAVLLTRAVATKEQLAFALERRDGDADSDPAALVESHVCRLRRKMRPFGLLIRSERYRGYWVDEPVRSTFRSLATDGGADVRLSA